MKRQLLFAAMAIFCLVSFGQTANQYSFSASSGTFSSISATGTSFSGIEGDDVKSSVSFGFTFDFEGTSYTGGEASSNGWLSFGSATSSQSYNSSGNASNLNPALLPLWDDLSGGSPGDAYYETTGSSPNRVYTLEWSGYEWNYNASSAVISFQIKIYETSNNIEFIYNQDAGSLNSPSATIGIVGATSTNYLTLDDASSSPTASSSTFTTSINAKPASGQVYTFSEPNCLPVENLVSDNLMLTSASIHWDSSASIPANGYTYVVKTTAGTPSVPGTAVTDTFVNLTGLSDATTYYWYVRAVCGAGDSSDWRSGTFATACGNISSYPYSQGFNGGVIPVCYEVSEGSGGASQHWESVTADASHGCGSASEGSHFLRMNYYNASTSYNSYYLTFQEMALPASPDYRANYDIWMGSSSGSNSLILEVSNDGGSSWTTLNTHGANAGNTASSSPWDTDKLADLSAYAGDTIILRLKATSNYGGGRCNIGFDDLKIEEIPSCLEPTAPSTSSISSTGATLSWVASVSSPGLYEYDYFTTRGAPAGAGTFSTSDTFAVATGLTGQTQYYWYVRSDCGGGDYSAWIEDSFMTACLNITSYPYSQGFNGGVIPACFEASEGSAGASQHWESVTADASHGCGAASEGSHFLRMNYYNAATGYNPYYLTFQSMELPASPNYRANYDIWMGSSSGSNSLELEISNDGGATWTTLNTHDANAGNTASSSPWDTDKIADLSSYAGDTIILRLKATSNYGGGRCNIGFDDLKIEEIPSCLEPTAPSTSSISGTGATLSWVASASSPGLYEYDYFTTRGAPAGAGTFSTSDTFAVATGLTGQTQYYWYVRSDCGGGDYSAWIEDSFMTACTGFTPTSGAPYTVDFDGLTANNGSISACITSDNLSSCEENDAANTNNWTARSAATGSSSTGPSADHTGSGNYIFLEGSSCYNDTSYISSQELDLTALSTHELSFYHHMYGANMGSLKVEITTNGGSTWDSLWYLSGNQGNSWEEAVVDLATYSAATQATIRFKGITGSGYATDMAIDDIRVGEAPCREPSALMSTPLATTATISWTAAIPVPSVGYEYDYSTTRGTPGGSGTPTTSTSVALSSLTGSTKYYWYVRSDCGGGDYSTWVEDSFTTLHSIDMGTNNLQLAGGCYGASETVKVEIENKSGVLIDYTVDNVTVDVLTTAQPGAVYSSTLVLSSGTLAPGAKDTVTMPTTIDMSTAGNYTFKMYTTVTGDGDATNDTTDNVTHSVIGDSSVPYCQDFGTTSNTPGGWVRNSFYITTTRGKTGSGIYKNIYNAGHSGTGFTLPKVGAIVSGNALKFEYKMTIYSSGAAKTFAASDKIAIEISTDCGNTYTEIDSIASNNHTATTSWTLKTVDLSAYATSSVLVRFVVSYGTDDYYADFDNFCIETPPTCLVPTVLSTSSVTATGATISWVASTSSPSLYEYDYFTTRGAPAGPGTFSTSDTFGVTTGLTAQTQYYWYVRSDCGGGDYSTWEEDSFMTACAAVSVTSASPYCETFDNATIPSCWSTEITKTSGTTPALSFTTSGIDPVRSPSQGSHFVDFNAYSSSGDIRLSSLPIDNSAMSNMQVSFDWHIDGLYPNADDRIVIQYSTDGGSTWTDVDSVSRYSATTSTWTRPVINMPAGAIGTNILVGFLFKSEYGNNCGLDSVCFDAPCTVGSSTPVVKPVGSGATTSTKSATKECLDVNGWTHYMFESGGNDTLVLSLKKNGNAIGTIGDGTFEVTVGAGTGAVDQSGATYVGNGNYWRVMNRWFDVTPSTQPSTNVGVKFYYTDTDFDAVLDSINGDSTGSVATHTDLNHYKFLDGTNPNPNNAAHAAVTEANFQYITNDASVSDSTYIYTTFGTNHVAEYETTSFSGGGGGGSGGGGPLPVKLIYFTANAISPTNARLEWATAMELNNDRFEIYRSNDGVNFDYLTSISGRGTTNKIVEYSYTDVEANALGNVVYYRLKQVDYNGESENSAVEKVLFNSSISTTDISIIPNPFNNYIVVSIDNLDESIATINILDVQGKLIQTQELTAGKSNNVVSTTDLPRGVYFINVMSKGVSKTLRMIKTD